MAEGTRRFLDALAAEYGSVGRFQFDGRTASLADVLDELRTYALLQKHKLVIVDDAQVFLAGGRGASTDDDGSSATSGEGPKRRRALEAYAENPCSDASLLLRSEGWRPGKLDKLVAKVGAIVKCEPLRDREAIGWCVQSAQDRYGCKLENPAARLLVERIGPSLGHLDTELAKLAVFVGDAGKINRAAVIALVGRSRQEQAWALQGAMLSCDPGQACTKLRELTLVAQVPAELVMWAIGDLLKRLHTAAHGLRGGATPGQLRRDLRLFGPSGDRLLEVARDTDPKVFAHLLRIAVDADQATKTGRGEKARNLEVLTLQVTDSIRCP